jgi:hypothetical protein
MKRLLTIILLIMSADSYAEWTRIDGNDRLSLYADKATIRRNGNLVKMWDLLDFKTAQKNVLSVKVQSEYDCKAERSRILAVTRFSGQMGNGTVVYGNNDSGKWLPIEPGSIGESKWKIACGKRALANQSGK